MMKKSAGFVVGLLVVMGCLGCARGNRARDVGGGPSEDELALGASASMRPEWSGERAVEALGKMGVLNKYEQTYMGKTLVHAELMAPKEELEAILGNQEKARKDFHRGGAAAWVAHAFGESSDTTFDQEGNEVSLSWWKPGGCRDVEYVRWSSHLPDRPRETVFLQISDGEAGKKHVWVRVESD